MRVTQVASPNQVAPTQASPQKAAEAKARAVAAFSGQSNNQPPSQHQQPPQQVVQDQNMISPEELGAIAAPIPQPNTDTQALSETTEVTAAEPSPIEPKAIPDPALSRQFAQLARQEKALRAKVQAQDVALKAREAALAEREAALTKQAPPDLSKYIPRDRLKQDPLSVLAEAEVSYDDITQQIVNQVPVDPRVMNTISQLQSQVKQLTEKLAAGEQSQVDSQKQQYDAAIKQIRNDANRLISNDPNYETIKATGSLQDVVDLITKTYEDDGELLTVEEAAQQVEDYLVEELVKHSKIKKIQQRLSAQVPATKPQPTQQTQVAKPQGQPQPMKTLTNANSSQRQLSARERAIMAFKGEKV